MPYFDHYIGPHAKEHHSSPTPKGTISSCPAILGRSVDDTSSDDSVHILDRSCDSRSSDTSQTFISANRHNRTAQYILPNISPGSSLPLRALYTLPQGPDCPVSSAATLAVSIPNKMFSFGGKPVHPTGNAANTGRKVTTRDTPPPSPLREPPSTPDSLEPAIDGPPSPERIRAYTEQMKRSSMFGNNSRTNTLSSATSSSRSRESTIAPSEHSSLSRKSSNRSIASSMRDRPESVQILGSLFSRNGRKARRENSAAASRNASPFGLDSSLVEEDQAKEHYGKKTGHRRRNFISGPYNFQHITHTRHDHLPDMSRTSRMELVSEFSAIRAAQAPSHGELKGIKAENLHFENFSSEEVNTLSSEPTPATSPHTSPERPANHRQSSQPPQRSPPRPMAYAKSHDNLRTAPVRPPRSPLSPTCPVALPARTSSRTASVLFDTFDPLATTTIERPHTNGGFRRPAPFALLNMPTPTLDVQQDIAVSPDHQSWPLTAPLSGNFGVELADVQEEEEDVKSKVSRMSTASADLRTCQSVPALRQSLERPETRMSTTLGLSPRDATFPLNAKQSRPKSQFFGDSWESDIDWCYDHEVEADCDYQWDRRSMEGGIPADCGLESSQPQLQLRLQNEERTYRGRFRPSLIVSSALEPPELSPSSLTSPTSADPRTPGHFLKTHIRSPSYASSFKESHGFHLSPSLLIPADFQSEMEQDVIYTDRYNHEAFSGAILDAAPYNLTPDEGESSTSSFLSDFSRGSARSSSSTRISGTASRGSQDSMMLLGRSSGLSQAHRSIGSASSLPDLVPSRRRPVDRDSNNRMSVLLVSDIAPDAGHEGTGVQASVPLPMQIEDEGSTLQDVILRDNVIQRTVQQLKVLDECKILSPVAEAFPIMLAEQRAPIHGRKTSAPDGIPTARTVKGRARASTATAMIGGKKRGSYMLFPQI